MATVSYHLSLYSIYRVVTCCSTSFVERYNLSYFTNAKHRDLFTSNTASTRRDMQVHNSWVLPYMTYCFRDLHGHAPDNHRTNSRLHIPTWKDACSTSHARTKGPYLDRKHGQSHRHDQQCEKTEVVLGEGTPTASKTTDVGLPQVSQPEDHATRKDDDGDQPNDGETTWVNTGRTRSHREQRKTCNSLLAATAATSIVISSITLEPSRTLRWTKYPVVVNKWNCDMIRSLVKVAHVRLMTCRLHCLRAWIEWRPIMTSICPIIDARVTCGAECARMMCMAPVSVTRQSLTFTTAATVKATFETFFFFIIWTMAMFL